ncbi:hypothetical protein [Buttiauxella sp.]|uniref:hypothetical protein n=1 Tax=Buttiauxella sp. TaxID=1972222 RepID=UPI003BB88718
MVCVEVSGLKYRCNSQNLAHPSGVHLPLLKSISLLHSCRCFTRWVTTHLGASMDSRAGF